MHGVTSIAILVNLFFITYQVFKCLEHPDDRKRWLHLFLLLLLLTHNSILGLFPDKKLNIPLVLQHFLYDGKGLAVSAYYVFYCYKSFTIPALKFHARWSVLLFIGLYFTCFISSYTLTNDVALSISYGMTLPAVYSFMLVVITGKAIYQRYKDEPLGHLDEVAFTFITVLPWGLIPLLSTLGIGQLQALILTNTGFLLFCLFHAKKEFRAVREQSAIVQSKNQIIANREAEIVHLRNLLEVVAVENMQKRKATTQSMKKLIVEKDAEILRQRDLLEATEIKQRHHLQSISQIIVEKDAEILRLHHLLGDTETINPKNEVLDTLLEDTNQDIPIQPISNASFEENCKKYLTKAQAEVIILSSKGYNYKEIAKRRGNKKEDTIKKIMNNISKRLNMRGRKNILIKLNAKYH